MYTDEIHISHLSGELVSDQLNFSESSATNNFDKVEVICLHSPLSYLRGHIGILREKDY